MVQHPLIMHADVGTRHDVHQFLQSLLHPRAFLLLAQESQTIASGAVMHSIHR